MNPSPGASSDAAPAPPGRVVAVIPVRGGSKSIPGKNIRHIAGRPLVYWSLDAATGCPAVDHVYVATDSEDIRAVVRAYGSSKVSVVDRSPETATDTASTESAMVEFARAHDFTHLVLIQATSPLIRAEDITRGLGILHARGADSLVSVVPQKRFRWSVTAEGDATPVNYDPFHRPRRQDFAGDHVENGAFYVSRRDLLLSTGNRLHGRMVACPMAEESYLELDEPSDWELIQGLLLQRQRAAASAGARPVRLFLTDVDGVLTDAGMYYTETGDELKKFNTRDGMGMALLRKAGIQVGIITTEDTRLVARRAAKLKVDHLRQGCTDKLRVVDELRLSLGLDWGEIAYIGDDINDLDVMQRVGWPGCPADARPEIRAIARHPMTARGGEGAVRELAHFLLDHAR